MKLKQITLISEICLLIKAKICIESLDIILILTTSSILFFVLNMVINNCNINGNVHTASMKTFSNKIIVKTKHAETFH